MDYQEKLKLFQEYERFLSVKGRIDLSLGTKYESESPDSHSDYKFVGGSQGVELIPKSPDFMRCHPLDEEAAKAMF